MTESAGVQTAVPQSFDAGESLGRQIAAGFKDENPDVVILFASPVYEFQPLLTALTAACRPKLLVGCSSAGEFTDAIPASASACAVALRSSDLRFGAGVAHSITEDRRQAAEEMVSTFAGAAGGEYRYRSLLLLTDALAGNTEELMDHLTTITAGRYQIFGGGAGDDAQFSRTHVFYGSQALSDAAVGLEILSNKPLGIGVSHGWQPATPPMRVTEVRGKYLVSLNATPAVEIFAEHAERNGARFDKSNPLPFFLHNVIGIETGAGHKLRVPLSVEADGSVLCAAEIPEGCTVRIMTADSVSAADAAGRATQAALEQLGSDSPPAVALFFDCAATRLRMGKDFGAELSRVAHGLNPARFAGCNTYGQIARVEGQFSGFHNCTAVICVIPE